MDSEQLSRELGKIETTLEGLKDGQDDSHPNRQSERPY